MSGLEDMSTMFSSLPYFDPFMSINLSCLCATTKLVQCVMYGISTCDVTRKFLYQSKEQATDIAAEDFYARKELIELVQKWEEDRPRDKGDTWEWTPILYYYELARGSCKRMEEYGHMVFTDPTLTRFLMVDLYGPPTCECGNPYHNDYRALVKMHAHQFMSLLKYVYHDKERRPQPEWIRATYTTNAQGLNPSFLVPTDTTIPPDPVNKRGQPETTNVLADTFIPSLTEHHFQRIDALLSRSKSWSIPPVSVREAVAGKGTKPDKNTQQYMAGRTEVTRECANCHRVNPKLQTCARCKLIFYCNGKCQKEHWRYHKVYCKEVKGPKPDEPKASEDVSSTEPKETKPKRVKKKMANAAGDAQDPAEGDAKPQEP